MPTASSSVIDIRMELKWSIKRLATSLWQKYVNDPENEVSEDNFVPLKKVCELPRIAELELDESVIANAIDWAFDLELNKDRTEFRLIPYEKRKKVSSARSIQKTPRSVYVGNLHDNITESLLYELFLQAGPLEDVYLPEDRERGGHKGFGFVDFTHEVSVKYACDLFDGLNMWSLPIRVQPSIPLSQASDVNSPRDGRRSDSPHQPRGAINSLYGARPYPERSPDVKVYEPRKRFDSERSSPQFQASPYQRTLAHYTPQTHQSVQQYHKPPTQHGLVQNTPNQQIPSRPYNIPLAAATQQRWDQGVQNQWSTQHYPQYAQQHQQYSPQFQQGHHQRHTSPGNYTPGSGQYPPQQHQTGQYSQTQQYQNLGQQYQQQQYQQKAGRYHPARVQGYQPYQAYRGYR